MKVLLIDPWGVGSTGEYLNGLIDGLSTLTQLTVVTNYHSWCDNEKADINKWFFKQSEKMERGYLRKLVRGFEYIITYFKILRILWKGYFDIVHVNWLLFYKIDNIFLKFIKRRCKRVIYTAHNAIPHIDGSRKIKDLQKIYRTVDRIIVHGEAIKLEILRRFPDSQGKIYIQKHGVNVSTVGEICLDCLPSSIKEKYGRYEKIFLMCGEIYPNKGTARLLKIWLENYLNSDALLIISGQQKVTYPQFEQLEKSVKTEENIEIVKRYVKNDEMNAMFRIADIILIPYIHASMSGTVFSAVSFSKPILFTDTGALSEYLEPGVDSFMCENSEEGIRQEIAKALNTDSKDLCKMGEMLHDNIMEKCGWKGICKHIVNDIYC